MTAVFREGEQVVDVDLSRFQHQVAADFRNKGRLVGHPAVVRQLTGTRFDADEPSNAALQSLQRDLPIGVGVLAGPQQIKIGLERFTNGESRIWRRGWKWPAQI